MMGRSPVLGVTRDEVSGEREQTGREASIGGRSASENLGQSALGDGGERGFWDAQGQHLRRQQVEWVEADYFGVAFDGGQGEVALAAFDTADVGAVHADQLGESFLGEPFGLAVGAEILADDALKISDCHVPKAHGMPLENLQTYK